MTHDTAQTNRFQNDLDESYNLSAAHVAAFACDGFLKLGPVFEDATLAYFGDEITHQTLALNTDHRPMEERSTYDRAFTQVMNLWVHNEKIRAFVFGKKLAKIATELLGVSGVRLYHDQALCKEPNGGITPTHADQYYWPFTTDRAITAWIPLQPVPPKMGPLGFFKGSQSVEFGRDLEISDESEFQIAQQLSEQGFAEVNEPFALGDVSFHSGWTFHRAGENLSKAPRAVMTMIFMDENMIAAEPQNKMQAADLAQWCPGVAVGSPIESSINPVLWNAAMAGI